MHMDPLSLPGGCGTRLGAVNTMIVRLYSICWRGVADLIVADVSWWQHASVP